MTPEEALDIVGTWVALETQKRKYPTEEVKGLSEVLILLKNYLKEVES